MAENKTVSEPPKAVKGPKENLATSEAPKTEIKAEAPKQENKTEITNIAPPDIIMTAIPSGRVCLKCSKPYAGEFCPDCGSAMAGEFAGTLNPVLPGVPVMASVDKTAMYNPDMPGDEKLAGVKPEAQKPIAVTTGPALGNTDGCTTGKKPDVITPPKDEDEQEKMEKKKMMDELEDLRIFKKRVQDKELSDLKNVLVSLVGSNLETLDKMSKTEVENAIKLAEAVKKNVASSVSEQINHLNDNQSAPKPIENKTKSQHREYQHGKGYVWIDDKN
jgi:hypothetical protein